MAVEAVIWDFGGVFTTSPFEAFNRYEASRGIPLDHIRTVYANNPHENAWALCERSEIDAAGFDRRFAAESRALGQDVRGADVLPLLSGDIRPGMVAALKVCKQRFKVGCITNNVMTGAGAGMASTSEKAAAVGEIMLMFDAVIESSKLGVRKPDPRIYQMMCDALGVTPHDCVFLDDLGGNLKPARAMGMTTIRIDNGPQAIAELETAIGMKLS